MSENNPNFRRKPHGGPPAGPREVALQVLLRVDQEGAYSGLELNKALEQARLTERDKGLATEIVYGTIQRLNTIDAALQAKVRGWPGKVEPWVKALLRLSCYQLRWLSRVPPHAVVDEAVKLAKKLGHAGVAGLVNGVLRGLLRDGFPPPPDGLPPAQRIALLHSHPAWLVERWIARYGEDRAAALCAANNEPPRQSARVNRLKTSRDALLAAMEAAGLRAGPSRLSADGVVAEGAGNLAATVWHRDGLLTVQDESAMLVAAVADPRPGMTAIDCCAAPGGKTTQLAERMGDRGRVVACDVHPHKERLIARQAERLGLASVETVVCDARELPDRLGPASADVVLLDAPCSGLGVIRRKPEIKWTKTPADIAALARLQRELLGEACKLVRPGGILVYSTCTIAPEENEEAARDFLKAHPDFFPDPGWPEEVLAPLRAAGALPEPFGGMVQLLPDTFGSDGFFIARFKRSL